MSRTDLPLVLATSALDPAGEAVLAGHARLITAPDLSPATINGMAGEAEGLVVRLSLPPDILDHAPRLRAIVRHGAGLDMLPIAQATARGIPIAYMPGTNAQAVAEHCFAAIFALIRRLEAVDRTMRSKGWGKARAHAAGATELGGKTLGIVGVGSIGRRVATVGLAFGATVLGATPRPETLPPDVGAVSTAQLFERSDIIVLACPLNDQTRRMVDGSLLSRAKKTALLVNVSRGAVVDDQAMVEALRSGGIAGAALDVFDPQPLPPEHPYFSLPNLLLTPHIAGLTTESVTRMSVGAAEEMVRLLNGEKPVNLVNPEVYTAA